MTELDGGLLRLDPDESAAGPFQHLVDRGRHIPAPSLPAQPANSADAFSGTSARALQGGSSELWLPPSWGGVDG
jgi:hypothetical protein